MRAHREPLLMIDRSAKTIALHNDGPITDEQRRGYTHIPLMLQKRWTCPSAGITQPATVALFQALAGYQVLEVIATIIEAFDASVVLAITDDGGDWIAAGDIGEQTAGDSESSLHTNQVNGVYYTAADTIDLGISGANVTVGTLGVIVRYVDWGRFEAFDLE